MEMRAMNCTKYSDKQITYAWLQEKSGTPVAWICLSPARGAQSDLQRLEETVRASRRHSGRNVAPVLERLVVTRGAQVSITVDLGTEYMSKALEEWAYRHSMEFGFTRPGQPVENVYIGSFYERLRDERSNINQFVSLEDARFKLETWRIDYNHTDRTALSAT